MNLGSGLCKPWVGHLSSECWSWLLPTIKAEKVLQLLWLNFPRTVTKSLLLARWLPQTEWQLGLDSGDLRLSSLLNCCLQEVFPTVNSSLIMVISIIKCQGTHVPQCAGPVGSRGQTSQAIVRISCFLNPKRRLLNASLL